MSFIKTRHREPYPAISPKRPELSQAGQTVLVTGAAGIAYYIAKGFAQAGATKIVLASRNPDTIKETVAALKVDVPEYQGEVVAKVCDVGDPVSSKSLWESLRAENVIVDVLVLNVAVNGSKGPLVDEDLHLIRKEFNINVLSHIDFAQRFVKQNRDQPNGHKKVILDVSSMVIHDYMATAGMPNYSLTKNSSTFAMQQIAKDLDDTQVISFHPGAIFTAAAQRVFGKPKEEVGYPFDEEDLPGAFSVWAASEEARFLHGRFVWAAWDVDEMRQGELAKRVESDPSFLKVGVPGLTLEGAVVA